MGWCPLAPVTRWLQLRRPERQAQQCDAKDDAQDSSDKTDTFPLSPRELIANRVIAEVPLLRRRVDRSNDTPLAALYRIYEHLVLDQHIEIRNEIEAFWWQQDWAVRDIPDPHDPDPERLACLACIPKLMCLAFNKRIELGLPRSAPPIFTYDQLDEWKAQERKYEQEPDWVARVPALAQPLAIPHWDNDRRDFVPLESFDDIRASPECATMNVLIWKPHVHFA
ncbi:hypothetical protein KVR01_010255 [Diaporthe batatas]|uniref:uncharacterized protein n=1 Tax=Diaporthe batatas TaxID=748121 RepID=UPI001D047C35|nr:uncharacterized protein KVR01_010255 [Diaporthe batatas]KAG8159618.1 hypothetical protein KVR01_010255 [Diaporthe batatas]